MSRAKAFLCVCLGILALVIAGTQTAGFVKAQSANRVVLANVTSHGSGVQVLDQHGQLWAADAVQGIVTGPVDLPKPGNVVAIGGSWAVNGTYVIYEDGDVYLLERGFLSNIFGDQPTQAVETTWGRVKAERR